MAMKTLKKKVWEFVFASAALLGITSIFISPELIKSLSLTALSVGIISIAINHIVLFFKKIDQNVLEVKNAISKNERNNVRD